MTLQSQFSCPFKRGLRFWDFWVGSPLPGPAIIMIIIIIMLCQLSSSSSSSLLCCVNYWRLSTSTTPRPAQDVEDVGEQVTPLHWDYQDKKMSGSPSINLRSWYSIMDKISVLTFCRGIQFIRSFGSFSLSYHRTQIPGKHSQGQWRDVFRLF